MSLVAQLDTDYTTALKAHDAPLVSILRLVRSAIKNYEINNRTQALDADAIAVIQREIKQHHESIEAFEKANRPEEVSRLNDEVAVLQKYLPVQLSEDELRALVAAAIAETGAQGAAGQGMVMKAVMPKVAGKTTGDAVGKIARELLGV